MSDEVRYEKVAESADLGAPNARVLINVYGHSKGRVVYEVMSSGVDLTDEEVRTVLAGAFAAMTEGSVRDEPCL